MAPPNQHWPYDPCPDCGSKELISHEKQSNDIILDDNGETVTIETRTNTQTILEVWCPVCDEKIWENPDLEE